MNIDRHNSGDPEASLLRRLQSHGVIDVQRGDLYSAAQGLVRQDLARIEVKDGRHYAVYTGEALSYESLEQNRREN